MNGFINILKPPGVSSHDVVDFIRCELNVKKTGHGGTLDPGAAGVLVIGVGQSTRLLEYAVAAKKKYRVEIIFGVSTSSGDSHGKIVGRANKIRLSEEKVEKALENFKGNIYQTPPMDSAIKYKGKKLYEYSRKGIEIERKKRDVTIYHLQAAYFFNSKNYRAVLDIECSKGTYIRSLCSEIGEFLGVGAYMSFLVRTGVGSFLLENSFTLDELKRMLEAKDYSFLLEPSIVLKDFPIVTVKSSYVTKVLNGAVVNKTGILSCDDIKKEQQVVLQSQDKKFLGIGEVLSLEKLLVKPKKVFN